MRKYFGTDGVRGVANGTLTPELAYKLGRIGGYIITRGQKSKKFVVGRDTRLSGEMLEAALIAGLMSVGIKVIKLGVIPTPGVAYLTRKLSAQGGVMISASHNPFEDNGIKFFNHEGYKLTDEIELEIESLLDATDSLPRPTSEHVGSVEVGTQYTKLFIDYLKSTVSNNFSGLKIVLDCANGAATSVAPELFTELGAKVITIANKPSGININVNCGSTHPGVLQQTVIQEKADIGLAFDGDADRLIAVDKNGNIIDGDQILYICGIALKNKGLLKNNTVVSTIMSNFGFKKILNTEQINNVQTQVGDRYVLEEMIKNDYALGGEQSGHIIFLDYNTTGDGILSGLQLVNVLVEEKKSLNKLVSPFKKYPQLLVNVKVKDKNGWNQNQDILNAIQTHEAELNGNGRILVRASGTENLIRVMAEGETEEIVTSIVNNIADVIKQQLN